VVETIRGQVSKAIFILTVVLVWKTALPWDLRKWGPLLIAMAGPHQIWEMQLPTGIVQTYAGTGREVCIDGPLTESAFAQPSGISTDGQGHNVADSEVSSIRGVGWTSPKREQCAAVASYLALATLMETVQKFAALLRC